MVYAVHSLILWNTDQVLLTGSPVTCMATDERYELNLFESASVLAVGCRDGKIHVYNLLSSRVVEEFTITTGQRAISHLAVSQGEIFSADAYSIHVSSNVFCRCSYCSSQNINCIAFFDPGETSPSFA